MASFNRRLLLLALPALAGCASMPGAMSPAADVYAGKSVLDAAIEAAGGQAALSQVKELGWTGSAAVTTDGKTSEVEVATVVRPFTYTRSTSWPKGKTAVEGRTVQTQFGEAWTVDRVVWTPMPDAQAEHETQQDALYGVMLLLPLKDAAAKVEETAAGPNGARNLHVEHSSAPPMDLRFDASGKLVRAAYSVRDPKGGAAPIPQVAEFSGEMTSNGVKWPKRITITQNGAAYFDLTLATFEARPEISVKPLEHTLEVPGQPPQGRPGDENAG
jgi:hypothetical protein